MGPFEVVERRGDLNLNVELKEVEGGPRLGRRHPIVNVKNVAKYEAREIPKKVEHEIERIEEHGGRGRGRKYKVVWKAGDVTWEPLANLVNGEDVVNKKLEIYWQAHPELKRGVA